MTDAKWPHSRNVDLFEKLSHKLASLVYSKTDGDKELLMEILHELNSVDFNVPCLKSNEVSFGSNHRCWVSLIFDILKNVIVKRACTVDPEFIFRPVGAKLMCNHSQLTKKQNPRTVVEFVSLESCIITGNMVRLIASHNAPTLNEMYAVA